eukprot:5153841-Prymnesium_polylepis.1
MRDNLPPDCKSAREKLLERYLHLGVGARRCHEIAAAYRVFGARHLGTLPPPWCRCPTPPRDSRSLPSIWRPSSRRC